MCKKVLGYMILCCIFLTSSVQAQATQQDAQLLLKSAEQNNFKLVKDIITRNISVIDSVDSDYKTALMYAAKNANGAMMQFLLDNGATVSKKDILNKDALTYAVDFLDSKYKERVYKAIERLVTSGGDIGSTKAGRYALFRIVHYGGFPLVKLAFDKCAGLSFAQGKEKVLLEAALKGDLAAIKESIVKGANVNAESSVSYTPLKLAVFNNKSEAVKLLLENGAKPIVGNLGRSGQAIEIAVFLNNKELAQVLFKAGSESYGLSIAAAHGRVQILQMLLNGNTSLNVFDKDDLNKAFEIAAKHGQQGIIEELLNQGVSISDADNAFFVAVEEGYFDIVQFMISKGANVNMSNSGSFKETPLIVAVKNGYFDIVKLLVESGADVNYGYGKGSKGTALETALKAGHIEIVALLLEKGAHLSSIQKSLTNAILKDNISMLKLFLNIDPSPYDEEHLKEALDSAVHMNKLDFVKVLVEAGIPITVDSKSAFYKAFSRQQWHIVNYLVSRGAKISVNTDWSTPPMYYAVQSNLEITKLLIEQGANINIITGSAIMPTTPLINAIEGKNTEIIKFLLEKGANPNIAVEHISPLHGAILMRNMEAVKLLIEYGADVNALNGFNMTPLSTACQLPNASVVKLLLDLDVSLNNEDARGRTAYMHAYYRFTEGRTKSIRDEAGKCLDFFHEKIEKPLSSLNDFEIATHYLQGKGGVRSSYRAMFFLRRAAEKGDTKSIATLGKIYLEGNAVERDYVKGFELLSRAVEQKEILAYADLGMIYMQGWGVEKNPQKAIELWAYAAQKDKDRALYYFAWAHLYGKGMDKNLEKGFALLNEHVLMSNSTGGKNFLAHCYIEGLGTPQNIAKGMELLEAAAKEGHVGAEKNLAKLKEKHPNFSKKEEAATPVIKKEIGTVAENNKATDEAKKTEAVEKVAKAKVEESMASKSVIAKPKRSPAAPAQKKPGIAIISSVEQDKLSLTTFTPDQKQDSCLDVIALHTHPLMGIRLEKIGGASVAWKTQDVVIKAQGVLAVQKGDTIINVNNASFSLDVSKETPLTLCVQDPENIIGSKNRMRVIFFHEDKTRNYSRVQH